MTDVLEELKTLAAVDIFKRGRDQKTFAGRPFYFDYTRVKLLVNDKWKSNVGGIPAGAFLLCAYDNEPSVDEMVLVRVLGPTPLPTDSDVIASMVDYYKESLPASAGRNAKLDSFTRYEFQFSGLECRVLGTFYRDAQGATIFGADVDSFYSSHNYSVYKPCGKVLEYIVNFREGEGIPGGQDQVRLGQVRYSASRRHPDGDPAPVFVSALDFVGKRTALFGMTRTGKSNTVKKIIEATVDLSEKGGFVAGEDLKPVGQIIFDVNGEYANANRQDAGTAIFELFRNRTERYSLEDKAGFKVMKLNFHADLEAGFGMLNGLLASEDADYVRSFLASDLAQPADPDDVAARTRWQRLVAAYRVCLYRAGFGTSGSERLTFPGVKELNKLAGDLDPSAGLSPDDAARWFTVVWENYETDQFFADRRAKESRNNRCFNLKSAAQ